MRTRTSARLDERPPRCSGYRRGGTEPARVLHTGLLGLPDCAGRQSLFDRFDLRVRNDGMRLTARFWRGAAGVCSSTSLRRVTGQRATGTAATPTAGASATARAVRLLAGDPVLRQVIESDGTYEKGLPQGRLYGVQAAGREEADPVSSSNTTICYLIYTHRFDKENAASARRRLVHCSTWKQLFGAGSGKPGAEC